MKLNSKKIRVLAVSAFISAALCGAGFASYSVMNAQDAVVAKAEDSVVYSLEPTKGTNNSYAGNCDITIGGITWNLTGNSTKLPWRIGGKSLTKVDRSLFSKTAINENVTKVDLIFGSASSITVNSLKFTVHSTAADAEKNLNPLSSIDVSFKANSTISVERPADVSWEGVFYRMTFNVTVSDDSNKFVQFKGAKFYGAASIKPFVEVNNPSAALNLGDKGTFTATATNATNPVITWTSSSSDVLKIEEATGAYEALKVGSSTVTASMTADDVTTPVTASFKVTVNYGLVTIAKANEITTALSGTTVTSPYELTITGYIVNLDGDGKNRIIVLSDKKKDATDGNKINVYGIFPDNAELLQNKLS